MKFTAWLAELFERHRPFVGLLIVAMSVVALVGHLPEGSRPKWRAEESEVKRDRADERARFSLGSPQCTLVVDGPSLFTPRNVAALREMVSALRRLGHVRQVVWIDTVPVTNAFGLPEPLLPDDDVSAEYFLEARRKALEHPLVGGQLLSPDGQTLLMPITFDWLKVTGDADVTDGLLRAARDAARDAGAENVRIRLTGNVPLYVEHQRSFDRNHYRFTITGYVIILLLAFVMFRGVRVVLILAAAPALGIFWSTGIVNLMNEDANPLTSVVLPVLVSMMGLTDGVHLLVHVRRRRSEGLSPVAASKSAIEHVGLACALTSLTTAIGFASLTMAESEVIQSFGRACATGVMVTFVAVITTIPLACSSFLGERIDVGHQRNFFTVGLRRFDRLFDWITGRPKRVAALSLLATAGFGFLAFQLRPDHTIAASQPTGSEAYRTLRHCDRAFGGVETVRLIVTWPRSQPWDDPKLVRVLEDAQSLLNGEELLGSPLSLNDLLRTFPGDTGLAERLPLMNLLPVELKRMFMDEEVREAYVTARVQDLGIARYEPVFDRIDTGMKQLERRHQGYRFEMVGQPVERGRELYQVVVDLALSLGTASVVILVVMAVVFRSLRLGLITTVPNMFPLAVTGAILYLAGKPLEVASVCSFTVCLGIAVDDTIHFLACYQRLIAEGEPNESAVRRTLGIVGAPLVMTTFVLVVGFATVMTSELPGQRTFAAMACSTIASALVGDLVFLPALLLCFPPRIRDATRASGAAIRRAVRGDPVQRVEG